MIVVGCLVLVLLFVAVVATAGMLIPLPWLGLRTRRRSLLGVVGAVVALAAIGLLSPRPVRTTKPPVEVAPESNGIATTTQTPAPASDPLEALRAQLIRAASSHRIEQLDLYRGTGRMVVAFEIADVPTIGLMKRAAMLDVTRILHVIHDSGIDVDSVFVGGRTTLVDVYGHESRVQVLRAIYSRATLDRINWQNFQADNVLAVADTVELTPPLR